MKKKIQKQAEKPAACGDVVVLLLLLLLLSALEGSAVRGLNVGLKMQNLKKEQEGSSTATPATPAWGAANANANQPGTWAFL